MTPVLAELERLLDATEAGDRASQNAALRRLEGLWDDAIETAAQAADGGRQSDAVARLTAIVKTRQWARLLSGDAAQTIDLALLEHLADLLRATRQFDDALDVLAVLRDLAEERNALAWRDRALLIATHVTIDLLDLESAGAILTRCLGKPDSIWMDAAQRLAHHRPTALYTVARLAAARGQLAEAARAFAAAIAASKLAPHEAPLAVTELQILLAEVHLDRGDLAAVDAVSTTGAADPRWLVIAGERMRVAGRFTDAVALGRQALEAGLGTAWSQSAALLVVQSLVFLNRPDEALGLLDAVAPSDRAGLSRLIELRRDDVLFVLPPTPGGASRPGVDTHSTPAVFAGIERTTERARRDWARLAIAARLALHAGETQRARTIAQALVEWSVDSTLLAARLRLLLAWIDLADAPARAAAQAEHAARVAEANGLLPTAWEAWRLAGRALEADHAAEAMRAAQRVFTSLQASLAPADRVLYRLNKWTAIEEAIADQCERVRDGHATASAVLAALLGHRASGEVADEAVSVTDTRVDVYSLARRRARAGRGTAQRLRPTQLLDHRRLPPATAVAVYAVLPDRVELFLVTRRGCTQAPVQAIHRDDVWHRVQMFWERCAFDPWSAGGRVRDLTRILGLEFIADNVSADTRRLVIVPDDILVHVPFSALPLAGAPLVSRFEISVMPHPHWAGWAGCAPRRFAEPTAICIESSAAAPQMSPLPAAQDSAHALDAAYGARSRTLTSNARTSREHIARALRTADLVEFACHGRFDPHAPHDSGLLAADGWMTDTWLAALETPSLAFASVGACYGGDVAVLPGGIQVGVPASLLAVGSRAVLCALWPLEDQMAGRFAQEFHANLERLGPSACLAQLQQRWSARYDPLHWAGYVLHVRGIRPTGWLGWWLRARDWIGRLGRRHRASP